MRQSITAEKAEQLRGIIRDIYARHNLGHIYKTAHLIPDDGFTEEPTLYVAVVFADDSRVAFIDADRRYRVAAKRTAISKVADFVDDIDDTIATAIFSTTESEYPVLRKGLSRAATL